MFEKIKKNSFVCQVYKLVDKILFVLMLKIKCCTKKRKIFILGTPNHGNLGDQAIIIAERKFLKDYFSDYKVIEVSSQDVVKYFEYMRGIINKSMILVHGGGFLGSLWFKEEEMFRIILRNFKDNLIIVFPQTIYFSNDVEGQKILKQSQKIYSSHKFLFICCREKYSYDYMKKYFPMCKVLLFPDMVLYLDQICKKANTDENTILFCMRNDIEKKSYELESVLNYLKEEQMNYYFTDTVINQKVRKFNRKNLVYAKIKEFSKARLVITDRLHGMIFAYIANRPCLVLENKSYKIKGVYEWIKNVTFIKLTDEKKIIKDLQDLLKINSNIDAVLLHEQFNLLNEFIKEEINDGDENESR